MFTMFNTKETTEGRRIEKVDAIAGTTRRYYYDDQRVAVQTLVSGNVETDDRYFVFGNYIDEVLVMHAAAGDLYYAHDHLYSPVALFAANGTVAERYEYDAYGKVQILTSNFSPLTSSQHGNPYAFTGRELDTLDAGRRTLMYYRARTYDPETGRFMQRDPLEYVDGTNLYEYVNGRPVNFTDSSGLSMNVPSPILPPNELLIDCDGECAMYVGIQTRPITEREKKSVEKGNWIWFGETSHNWRYNVTSDKSDCEDCQKKVLVRACNLMIDVWYIDPPSGLHDTQGNTPKQHESYHLNSLKSLWSDLTGKTSGIINRCMNEKQAACYVKALNSYSAYLKSKYEYENYKFDCETYSGTVERNAAKRRACNLSNEHHKIKVDKAKENADNLFMKCDEME